MKTLLYYNRGEPKYMSVINYYFYQRHRVLLNYVAFIRSFIYFKKCLKIFQTMLKKYFKNTSQKILHDNKLYAFMIMYK